MDNHYWETRTGDNTFIPENAYDKSKIISVLIIFPNTQSTSVNWQDQSEPL